MRRRDGRLQQGARVDPRRCQAGSQRARGRAVGSADRGPLPGLAARVVRTPDQCCRSPLARPPWTLAAISDLISTFVRLVPEKGVDRILDIAEAAGGRDRHGFRHRRNRSDGRGSGRAGPASVVGVNRPAPRRARSAGGPAASGGIVSRAAALPRAADWEETFGIAAVEYQALGVPVLASDSPGFRESCALPMFRLNQDAPSASVAGPVRRDHRQSPDVRCRRPLSPGTSPVAAAPKRCWTRWHRVERLAAARSDG